MGVIPRSIDILFNKLSTKSAGGKRRYSVYCSFLQIYNEKIFDLLSPSQFLPHSFSSAGLQLRFKRHLFAVDNLYTFECKTREEVNKLFSFGVNNRVVSTHCFNHASSRSHTLLTLTVESVDLHNMVNVRANL